MLSGLAGMLVAARSSSGLSTIGSGLELEAIAAVVIGGTLLSGGAGGLTGTLIGVLLLGVIQNLINQVGTLRSYHQQVVSGLFLVVVVTAQTVVGTEGAVHEQQIGCGSPSSAPVSGGGGSTPGVRPAPRRRAVRHRRTVEREDRAAGTRVRHHALRRPRRDARDESPDLVSLCLPNEDHFDTTLRVIEAGFPLLVEKPLVFDLAEADRLLARG